MKSLGLYSVLIAAPALLGIAMAATWRLRRRWLRVAIPAGLLAAMTVGFLLLRTGAGNVSSVDDVTRALASGRPVLLEFYSDYRIACLKAKPVVDGLEDELGDQAVFLRADLLADVGAALGARYEVDATPTFLVFDRRGKLIVKQRGKVPAAALREAVAATD